MDDALLVTDLGRLGYADAYAEQVACVDRVISGRASGALVGARIGKVLLVEHDPVVTVTRRPGAAGHVLAGAGQLERLGIEIHETDRGGDVTYHGPGQLVVYPIVDLNRLNCRIHEYLRLLEAVVIETLAEFGVVGERDESATGVWLRDGDRLAKVCAMGVRVRRWVTMHGLAINVDPDLAHFGVIVPCGLVGRPVTSLREILAEACPSMDEVKRVLIDRLRAALHREAEAADARRL